jgi:hypothetical protein
MLSHASIGHARLRVAAYLTLSCAGVAAVPSATAAQLGTAVSLGLGVATTGSLCGGLAHGMAALRVSPQRLQPASLRVDATISSGVHYNVGAFMANAMVPMGSDTDAAVPYLLLGGAC